MSVDKRFQPVDPNDFVTGVNAGDVLWSKQGVDNIARAVFRVDSGTADVQVNIGADWCTAEAFPLLNEQDAAAYSATQTGGTTLWTVKGKFSGIRFRQSGAPAAELGELTLYNE